MTPMGARVPRGDEVGSLWAGPLVALDDSFWGGLGGGMIVGWRGPSDPLPPGKQVAPTGSVDIPCVV